MKFLLPLLMLLCCGLIFADPSGDGGGKPAAAPRGVPSDEPATAPGPAPGLPSSSDGVPAAAGVPVPIPVEAPAAGPGPAAPADPNPLPHPREWYRDTVPSYLLPGTDQVAWDLDGWWSTMMERFMRGLRLGGIEAEFFQLLEAVVAPEVYEMFVEQHLAALKPRRQVVVDGIARRALEAEQDRFDEYMLGRDDITPRNLRSMWGNTARNCKASWKSYTRCGELRFERNVHGACREMMAGMAAVCWCKQKRRRGEPEEDEDAGSSGGGGSGSATEYSEEEENDEEESMEAEVEEEPARKKPRTRGPDDDAAGGSAPAAVA